MSSNYDGRVLQRRGARELSQEEVDKVTGRALFVPTLLSIILTRTPSGGFDDLHDT